MGATPKQIYEAMLTGPQNMPVFANQTLTPEDEAAPSSSTSQHLREAPDPGGSRSGASVRSPRACSSGWSGSVRCSAVAVWIGAKVR